MTCDYCKDKPMKGVHCPSDFDDREPCRDGKVFVAKCDACFLTKAVPHYVSDAEAAEAVAKVTGWKIEKSFDETDAIDPEDRKRAKDDRVRYGHLYYRPYFAVTMVEAIAKVG